MKRCLCLLLCAALFICTFAFSASAEDDGFIFVYGDQLIFADASNAPIVTSSAVYFPMDFIFSYTHNSYVIEEESNVVNVFFRNMSIAFDTQSGIAVTTDNRNLYETLLFENGKYYISMQLIAREDARFFTTLTGGVYRLKEPTASVLDADFNRLFEIMPRASSLRGKTASYRFIVFGTGSVSMRQIEAARAAGVPIAVFITDSDITDSPNTVCSLLASGMTVGIYPSDSFMSGAPSDSAIASEVERINELLYRLTRTHLTLCALKSGYNSRCATLAAEMSRKGMSLWCASLRLPDGFSADVSDTVAARMWNNLLPFINWDMCIELAPTATATSVFEKIVPSTSGIKSVTPGASPVNYVETVGS